MKPMMILPEGQISKEDIAELKANGLCVVEAKDPAQVKFVDALPELAQRAKIDNAAVQLSKVMLHGQWGNYTNSSAIGRSEIAKIFVDILTKGTELDARGTPSEVEAQIYDHARAEEVRKIAREDARAERAAKSKKLIAAAQPAKSETK